jgi:hypothetical protein
LDTTADLVGWLLLGAVAVGYGQLASALYRSGYATVRVAALLPLLAAGATAGYAVVVAVFAPGLRSPVATLNLAIVAFLVGVPAYGAHTILPIAADRQRQARVLAVRWHLDVIAYQSSV